MNLFPHWPMFITEFGLIFLSFAMLVLDMLWKDDEKRGERLAALAMAGVGVLFAVHCLNWGHFGTALKGSYVMDGVAFVFKALFLLAGAFTLFMARDYQASLKRGRGEFTLLILFAMTGTLFVASANDFVLLFVAVETLTVSLYIMTAYLRDRDSSIEAGVKYLILGALSTAVFLYGLSFVYGAAGSTNYDAIQAKLGALGAVPAAFTFGMVLVVASLGFKIAAVPFQLWAPDVYEGAPTPVTAFLAIASKAAGFAALVRLMMTAFAPALGQLMPLLAVLSALTMIYGNLGAIPQKNIKRLMGYSSIGHAGYLLVGLAAFLHSGSEAVLVYLISYLFSTGSIFLVLVALSRETKTDAISELAGLSRRSPVLAAAMMLGLLSLAGVPPLAGFFSKFYLLWSAVNAGLLWLAVIGVFNVITSLYFYLKIVKTMYVDAPASPAPLRISPVQKAMQYFAVAGILVLGVYPGPLVRLVELAFAR